MNEPRKIVAFPAPLHLSPEKPRPQFATVRFLRADPRGTDLVRSAREAAAGYRGLAAKYPAAANYHQRMLALARKHEAVAEAEEARLARAATTGELFHEQTPSR